MEARWASTPRVLAGAGALALLGAGVWLATRGAERPQVQGGAAVAGALALVGAALLPRRPGVGALLGAAGGIVGALAVSWAYAAVSFPYVDGARPWGMDWSPTPVARPTIGLLLVLFAGARALGPPGPGRWPARALAFLACAYVVGWWAFPRWYEMDLVAKEGIVPNLPSFVPQPGRVGAGDTPAVLGGKLVRLHWTQYAYQLPPFEALWYVLHRELAVGALAHGLHWEVAEAKVATGALTADAAARDAAVRAGLWAAQRGAVTGWLYAHAAVAALLALTGLRLLWPRPCARWGTLVRNAVRVVLYGAPVVNLLLLAAGAAAGLPDVRSGGLRVLGESVALLVAVAVVDRCGAAIPAAAPAAPASREAA